MLYEFIDLNRDEIVRRCRAKVASRPAPPPTAAEIDHGVPLFLDQLIDLLRLGHCSSPEMTRTALLHGGDLLRRGFTASQVVHDYGDVCQSITELAMETGVPITTEDFHTLNGVLDNAIAQAVTQYGRDRNQSTLDGSASLENERLGYFTHELRNLIHTAIMAFEVVKSGGVGVAGSTGTVLHRSLLGARDLIARSLAEVGLTRGIQNPEVFRVSDFIDSLAQAATLTAAGRGLTLVVNRPADDVLIEADRQVLSAVATNVLLNAFKFTKPHTTITLTARATEEHVFIDVQDECGGLPDEDIEECFRPFERRGLDRTGLGLGLAFSRWAVEANHGIITARNIPGTGCVFTVELPRVAMPTPAAVTAHS